MTERSALSLETLGINLPYSSEAEQAVLGAIIVDSKVIDDLGGIILPEHFYHRQNAAIYKEMLLMFNAGLPVDFVTILDAVQRKEVFESEADAKLYLFNIAETVPTLSNASAYAHIVYEKYLMRSLIGACRDIMDHSMDGQESASTLLDFAEQRIYEIRSGRNSTSLWQLDSVLLEVMEHLTKLSGPDRDQYRGMMTGFVDLDRKLTGLNKSDLIILAARPSVGKTSLALNIAINVAKSRDVSVAFFSLEMSKQQLAQRVLSAEAQVVSNIFRTGEVEHRHWLHIAQAADRLTKVGVFIDDTSMISVQEMKSKARRLKNLGLVVVDYLQLMGGQRTDSRVNEISAITRAFKIMAKELNVPVILLSQLSRENDKQRRPPRLSDLRDSGSIEQDADIVLFLHRDDTEEVADDDPRPPISLYISKNRNGETGKISLQFDDRYTTFTSAAHDDQESSARHG